MIKYEIKKVSERLPADYLEGIVSVYQIALYLDEKIPSNPGELVVYFRNREKALEYFNNEMLNSLEYPVLDGKDFIVERAYVERVEYDKEGNKVNGEIVKEFTEIAEGFIKKIADGKYELNGKVLEVAERVVIEKVPGGFWLDTEIIETKNGYGAICVDEIDGKKARRI